MNSPIQTLAAGAGLRRAAAALATPIVVLMAAMAIALAAQVRLPVPGTAVPMTLQGFAVLLCGMLLSPGRAGAAVACYLTAGACGLGVFAPGSAGLVGPTAGYLAGFVPAAVLISLLSGSGRGVLRLHVAGALGMAVMLACGVTWLAWVVGMSWGSAASAGLLPFVPKAAVEVSLAAWLIAAIRSRGGSAAS